MHAELYPQVASPLNSQRSKIKIKNINQLLQNKRIIIQPEQKLKRTFDSLQPSALVKKEYVKENKKGLKLNFKHRNQILKERQTSYNIFSNNKIYDKTRYGDRGYKTGWTPEKSAQLAKRFTMPQFKFKSLEVKNQQFSKNNTNSMWRPIHYVKKSVSLQKSNIIQNSKIAQLTLDMDGDLGRRKSHQFLKKGTDINKRVVLNLLKLKLSKKLNDQQPQSQTVISDGQQTIRNNEILKMIKIYKGYGQTADSWEKNKKLSELKLYQSSKTAQWTSKKCDENAGSEMDKELDIKTFPFRNINIQLSVSKWNSQRGRESAGISDIQDGLM